MRSSTVFVMVAAGVLAAIGSWLLAARFEWPARLDDRAAAALPAFAAAEGAIRLGFAMMLVASLALVPVVLDLGRLLGPAARTWTVFGVAGAFVQTLGWVRWPIVVPQLARRYLAAPPGSPERDAVGSSYDLINAYAGGALGEHLGWLFMGVWAIGLGLLGSRIMPKWLAAVGLLPGVRHRLNSPRR